MRGAIPTIATVLGLGILVSLETQAAVWVCHGPDDITWQQEYPPCVMPAEVADEIKRRKEGRSSNQRPSFPASQRQANAASNPSASSAYQTRLKELERQYPELNPDSKNFRKDLEQLATDRMARLRQAGVDPVTALNDAVHRTMSEARRAPATTTSVQRGPTQTISPSPTTPISDSSQLLNKFASGAVGAAGVLIGLALVVAVVRFLFRLGLQAAVVTTRVVQSTSVEDIARTAGSVTGTVERKTRPLVEAFRQGRDDSR